MPLGESMIVVIKNNKNLFKKKKRSIKLTSKVTPFTDSKKASPELLEEIKRKMKRKKELNNDY